MDIRRRWGRPGRAARAARLGIGIVGCGQIAPAYLETLHHHPTLAVVGLADLVPARAEACARRYGGRVHPDLEALLADPAVQAVVNLTPPQAHAEVNRRCLEAGKHVFSEKPLALTYAEAAALADLAARQGVHLMAAPITYMGEAQQTAGRYLREGRLGTVRLVYAESNHGRIETWHPRPQALYRIGPIWDMAIYALTVVTAFLGPVREVQAWGGWLLPERVDRDGVPFRPEGPDWGVVLLRLAQGAVMRLSVNYYTRASAQGEAIEFHGDTASLHLGSAYRFDAPVLWGPHDGKLRPVPWVQRPFAGVDWSRGVADLAEAVLTDRSPCASLGHVLHVIEVLEAVHRSLGTAAPVAVTSDFAPPLPMPWA
ncbi:MAG: Gfo/Idh/MocA family oxidoreductase [Anaerolineae bacterium]|nr:Gfo/Idh/MocA family oxidoreductase [Caldilineales bacterium]MDW8268964.1 Gfo/Idh/MocA family oxidoreductase [Anaerolineae bacterium]